MGKARFLFVEVDPTFRSLFAQGLGRHGELVFATAREAASCAEDCGPWSAFVVDTNGVQRGGADLLRRLRSACPDARAAVLSACVDREFVNAVADLGALYFLKPVDLEAFARFLERPAFLSLRVERVSRGWAGLYGLTEAESDVLQRSALGESREAIAEARGSSALTLQKHVSNLLRRTKDDSLQSAVARLLREVLEN